MPKNFTHINRAMTDAERQTASQVRAAAEQDFPPKPTAEQAMPPAGIPARIFAARKARGLTRYALGQLAGVPAVTIRDMEQGDDVPLSQLQAVAHVLGSSIELVDFSSPNH